MTGKPLHDVEIKEPPPPKTLLTALLGFQGKIGTLSLGRDQKGQVGSRKYAYLSLEKLHEEAMPLLNAYSLVWTTDLDDGFITYELAYAPTGEVKRGRWKIPEGTPQEQGSAISYFRRYGFLCSTGIVPAGEDDDAAKASIPRSEQPTKAEKPDNSRLLTDEEKAAVLKAMSGHRDSDMLLRSVGCDDLDSLTVEMAWELRRKLGPEASAK